MLWMNPSSWYRGHGCWDGRIKNRIVLFDLFVGLQIASCGKPILSIVDRLDIINFKEESILYWVSVFWRLVALKSLVHQWFS